MSDQPPSQTLRTELFQRFYPQAAEIVKKYAPGEHGLSNHLAHVFSEIHEAALAAQDERHDCLDCHADGYEEVAAGKAIAAQEAASAEEEGWIRIAAQNAKDANAREGEIVRVLTRINDCCCYTQEDASPENREEMLQAIGILARDALAAQEASPQSDLARAFKDGWQMANDSLNDGEQTDTAANAWDAYHLAACRQEQS